MMLLGLVLLRPTFRKVRFQMIAHMTPRISEPDVFVFPAKVVAEGLNYFYSKRFSRSPSYELALNSKPRHGAFFSRHGFELFQL
jgi:hypothetical protein